MSAGGLPLRPELRDVLPYGAPQLQVPVLLNVNENPFAPPAIVVDAVTTAVAQAARGLNRYPDREFRALRADLAAYLLTESRVALGPDQIWAANGSNEVMLHLFQAFGGPGRSALSFAPTYSMYPQYARDTHTRWAVVDRGPEFQIDLGCATAAIARERPALILLASPNNPTGTHLGLETLREILCVADEVVVPGAGGASPVVVIDEAYAEFRRPGMPTALELLDQYPNLAVTRTMSKAFAAAGLRLGYLAAAPRLVDALRVVRLPYHLSSVTQAAASAVLSHAAVMLSQVAALRTARDDLLVWLRGQAQADHTQVVAAESDANFVLFGQFADRRLIWSRLLDRGVLIREVGPAGWLRVSIGTPDQNAQFKGALLAAMRETGDIAND